MSYIINQEFSPLDNNNSKLSRCFTMPAFFSSNKFNIFTMQSIYIFINICTCHVNKDISQITVHFAWIHFKISITVLVQFFSKSLTNLLKINIARISSYLNVKNENVLNKMTTDIL